jgi:hypothetical protein
VERSEPDRSEDGLPAETVDAYIKKFGGLRQILKMGEFRPAQRQLKLAYKAIGQNLGGVDAGIIRDRLEARGIHFARAPDGWDIGAANGLLWPKMYEGLVVILPTDYTLQTLIHELQVLIPDLTHEENEALMQTQGELVDICHNFPQLAEKIADFLLGYFGPVADRSFGAIDNNSQTPNQEVARCSIYRNLRRILKSPASYLRDMVSWFTQNSRLGALSTTLSSNRTEASKERPQEVTGLRSARNLKLSSWPRLSLYLLRNAIWSTREKGGSRKDRAPPYAIEVTPFLFLSFGKALSETIGLRQSKKPVDLSVAGGDLASAAAQNSSAAADARKIETSPNYPALRIVVASWDCGRRDQRLEGLAEEIASGIKAALPFPLDIRVKRFIDDPHAPFAQ